MLHLLQNILNKSYFCCMTNEHCGGYYGRKNLLFGKVAKGINIFGFQTFGTVLIFKS